MDKQIEELAQLWFKCVSCKSIPAVATLHLWVWPDNSWQRGHLDFVGPFQNKKFPILVDVHSYWPEVVEMWNITCEKTVEVLQFHYQQVLEIEKRFRDELHKSGKILS